MADAGEGVSRSGIPTAIDRWRSVLFGVLLFAFVGRVTAQFTQWVHPTSALPQFESFQSGALPYPVLLACQASIIVGGLIFLVGTWRGSFTPRRYLGRVLRVVGTVYFFAAAFRLLAGLTFLRGVPFFALPIPSMFHMVLAGMLLLVGDFHARLRASQPRNSTSPGQ